MHGTQKNTNRIGEIRKALLSRITLFSLSSGEFSGLLIGEAVASGRLESSFGAEGGVWVIAIGNTE